MQIDNEVEYQKALVEIKDEIREKEGDEIVEKMKEECRDWFQEDKEETGKFPDYPSDDEGGSGAVFHPELQPDYEENQDAAINQSDKEESTSKKAKAGKEGNSSKEDKSGADKKGKEDSDDDGFKLTESEFVKGLKAADKTFVGRYILYHMVREKGMEFYFQLRRWSYPAQRPFLIARLARSDPRNSFLCCPCIFLFVLAFSFSSLHFHFCPCIFIKLSKNVKTCCRITSCLT